MLGRLVVLVGVWCRLAIWFFGIGVLWVSLIEGEVFEDVFKGVIVMKVVEFKLGEESGLEVRRLE